MFGRVSGAGAFLAVAACGGLSCGGGSSSGACMPIDEAGSALAMPAQIGALTCATEALPDVTTQSGGFQVDTGAIFVGQPPEYSVGAAYGQPSCPDQFLVEADLTTRGEVKALGTWSVVLPGDHCGYRATMTVFGDDGTGWARFDQITSVGEPFTKNDGSPGCNGKVTSRLIASDLDVSTIPANRFVRARVAVVATECDQKVPIGIELLE